MQALGERLRNAREEMGATLSEAAEATKIKVQHIEALENEDFAVIAAPIYVKGFLKLYAEYLGIEPGELIEQYNSSNAPLSPDQIVGNGAGAGSGRKTKRFNLSKREQDAHTEQHEKPAEPSKPKDYRGRVKGILKSVDISPRMLKQGLTLLGGLLVLVLIISSIGNCAHKQSQKKAQPADDDISLIEGIPEPYLEPELMPKN